MSDPFFDHPILNSPYVRPIRHWELDVDGQPTQKIIETRRRAEFITPIPKPKKRKGSPDQQKMIFDEGRGLSDAKQQYDPNSIINDLRQRVDQWRPCRIRPSGWLPRRRCACSSIGGITSSVMLALSSVR
jgi:type III restriction enzyme